MITLAKIEDLRHVTDLAKWFYHQLNPDGEFKADNFVTTWTALLQAGSGLIIIRQCEARIREAIGVMIYADPNDGKLAAGFGFWYIDGEDDSLANGLLHCQLEIELRKRGVHRVFTTNLLNRRYNKVEQFLLHAGYKPVEVNFRKDL